MRSAPVVTVVYSADPLRLAVCNVPNAFSYLLVSICRNLPVPVAYEAVKGGREKAVEGAALVEESAMLAVMPSFLMYLTSLISQSIESLLYFHSI